jgi:hypothetical protein
MFSFRFRTVTCPDGMTHYVYRNPSKAFPLALKNASAQLSASVKALEGVQAGVSAENKSSVSALLIRLDETNSTMQSEFNAVYQVWASSPCSDPQYLRRKVDEILETRRNLQEVLIQARTIENLISSGQTGQPLMEAIQLALQLTRPPEVQKLISDIAEATEQVSRWAN